MEVNEGVKGEINDMLEALGDKIPEPEKKEPENKETETNETKETKETEEEKPAVEESEEKETEEEEESKGDDKEDEEPVDDKDKTIAELRAQIEKLSSKETPEKKEDEKKEPEKKEPEKKEPLTFESHDFIGDLDLEDVIRDKDEFNKLLNNVYVKGVTDAKKMATEGVLLSIPEIVKHNIEVQKTLKEASDKFYEDNKDLAGFRKVVAAVFEEVAAENPGKSINDIMLKVAPEARKRLGLAAEVKKDEKKSGGKPPVLPEKKGGQRHTPTKPDTSSIQSEIEAMNKSLGR